MASAVIANPILARLQANRGMIFPFAFISLLMVLLIPLPTAILDLLLVLNITLSVIVLVTTIYVQSPLEFAVFPSLLLAVTLFRLVLNVATTRLILTAPERPPEQRPDAEGVEVVGGDDAGLHALWLALSEQVERHRVVLDDRLQ